MNITFKTFSISVKKNGTKRGITNEKN